KRLETKGIFEQIDDKKEQSYMISSPQILRLDLSTPMLQLMGIGIDINSIPLLTKPSGDQLEKTAFELQRLGAVSGPINLKHQAFRDLKLTENGNTLSKLPLSSFVGMAFIKTREYVFSSFYDSIQSLTHFKTDPYCGFNQEKLQNIAELYLSCMCVYLEWGNELYSSIANTKNEEIFRAYSKFLDKSSDIVSFVHIFITWLSASCSPQFATSNGLNQNMCVAAKETVENILQVFSKSIDLPIQGGEYSSLIAQNIGFHLVQILLDCLGDQKHSHIGYLCDIRDGSNGIVDLYYKVKNSDDSSSIYRYNRRGMSKSDILAIPSKVFFMEKIMTSSYGSISKRTDNMISICAGLDSENPSNLVRLFSLISHGSTVSISRFVPRIGVFELISDFIQQIDPAFESFIFCNSDNDGAELEPPDELMPIPDLKIEDENNRIKFIDLHSLIAYISPKQEQAIKTHGSQLLSLINAACSRIIIPNSPHRNQALVVGEACKILHLHLCKGDYPLDHKRKRAFAEVQVADIISRGITDFSDCAFVVGGCMNGSILRSVDAKTMDSLKIRGIKEIEVDLLCANSKSEGMVHQIGFSLNFSFNYAGTRSFIVETTSEKADLIKNELETIGLSPICLEGDDSIDGSVMFRVNSNPKISSALQLCSILEPLSFETTIKSQCSRKYFEYIPEIVPFNSDFERSVSFLCHKHLTKDVSIVNLRGCDNDSHLEAYCNFSQNVVTFCMDSKGTSMWITVIDPNVGPSQLDKFATELQQLIQSFIGSSKCGNIQRLPLFSSDISISQQKMKYLRPLIDNMLLRIKDSTMCTTYEIVKEETIRIFAHDPTIFNEVKKMIDKRLTPAFSYPLDVESCAPLICVARNPSTPSKKCKELKRIFIHEVENDIIEYLKKLEEKRIIETKRKILKLRRESKTSDQPSSDLSQMKQRPIIAPHIVLEGDSLHIYCVHKVDQFVFTKAVKSALSAIIGDKKWQLSEISRRDAIETEKMCRQYFSFKRERSHDKSVKLPFPSEFKDGVSQVAKGVWMIVPGMFALTIACPASDSAKCDEFISNLTYENDKIKLVGCVSGCEDSNRFALSCGCKICSDCTYQMLKHQAGVGQGVGFNLADSLTCKAHGRIASIIELVRVCQLNSDMSGLLELARSNTEKTLHEGIRVCLGNDCGRFVSKVLKTDPQRFISCVSCSHTFCCACGKNHSPDLGCDDLGSTKFIQANFKLCKHCGVYVEKISGCNRISCRCGWSFCFVCGFSAATSQEVYAHLKAKHGGYY
ncbi:hypothetical protein ADUPG1_013845, partial [Aduncisulcus paluster]